jgi:hypothetical protein
MQLQEDIVIIVWDAGVVSEEVTLETTAIIKEVLNEDIHPPEEVEVAEVEAAEAEVAVEAEGVNNGNEN